MLISLHVKNIALIDEMEVFFGKGLNILTGETGAGKSLVIGSVNLALGAKADKELIRKGAEYALIELVFQTEDKNAVAALQELDIPLEEDGSVIIQRRIMSARSVCKVNGEAVSNRVLKELAQILIDIHGQHEHQSLLHKKKHLEILDNFSYEYVHSIKENLKVKYKLYQELTNKIKEEAIDERDKEKELSLLAFEIQEIESAAISIGEDEELETLYRKMKNSKRMIEVLSHVHAMTGYENAEGVGETVSRALKELGNIAALDKQLEKISNDLVQIEETLNDFNRNLSEYLSDMEFAQEDFVQTEDRLNILNHLKVKYGNTLEEVLFYAKEQKERQEMLLDFSTYILNLKNKQQKAEQDVGKLCKLLSSERKKAAKDLEKRMQEALVDLNFLDVQFEIQVREQDSYSANGFDEVEFMISTNPGEQVKPLGNVASGGELSRIMLSIKTVLADKDDIGTLIFDEIDAGISGKTAWKVSEKLAVLGAHHQVICITHLPQIAAMADVHFVIEKNAFSTGTTTDVKELKEEASLKEIARLLGGEIVTDAAIANAKELKELAVNTKLY